MSITLRLDGQIRKAEGKIEFKFGKERIDFANLFRELKEGKKLSDIFPKGIAQHVEKMLLDEGYIDSQDNLTTKGEHFIEYPYKDEIENGLFTFNIFRYQAPINTFEFVPEAQREITSGEQPARKYSIEDDPFVNNEFCISDEKGVFKDFTQLENCQLLDETESYSIDFNLSDNTYYYKGKNLKSGAVALRVKEIAREILDTSIYDSLDLDNEYIRVDDIANFTDDELLNGKLSSVEIKALKLKDIPLHIEDIEIAKKYIYFILSERVLNGEYLNIDDMNDIYYNEIATSPIFDEELASELHSISIVLGGFKEFLGAERYSALQYKLRILEILLDYKNFDKDNNFAQIRNYDQFVEYLEKFTDLSDVKAMYLVMGYYLSKNSRNKILDCLKTLKQKTANITIVDKGVRPDYKKDDTIASEIEKMGISIVKRPRIGEIYHDRFVVIRHFNGRVDNFLMSCEIGELFNLSSSNEPKGTLKIMDEQEIIRQNKSLIELIEEGGE